MARSQSETVKAAEKAAAEKAAAEKAAVEKAAAQARATKAAAEKAAAASALMKSIGMEFVEISKGDFQMGRPAGQVRVSFSEGFELGKTEVTQGQWQAVMGTEPWAGQQDVKIGKDLAASYVSWNDATAFCQKLTGLERKAGKLKAGESYRLPTEAQWEYACRAGTTTTYSFGDDKKQLGQYAWFDGNTAGEQYAHAVGFKRPNPWGLRDMHGNVWEWCSDWYGEKLLVGADPVGPGGGSDRVFRGGCWWSFPGYCRSASRHGNVPSRRFFDLGFRVARSQSAQ